MNNYWIDRTKQQTLVWLLQIAGDMTLGEFLEVVKVNEADFDFLNAHRIVTFTTRAECERNTESSISQRMLEKSPSWDWWLGLEPGVLRHETYKGEQLTLIDRQLGLLGLMLEPPLDYNAALQSDKDEFSEAVHVGCEAIVTFKEFMEDLNPIIYDWFLCHKIVPDGCRLII